MSKAKVNYTDEQVNALVAAYTAAKTEEDRQDVVESFADSFGKPLASIRAKLVREGVYVPKADTAKNGQPRVKKETLVERIAKVMQVSSEALPGLEKAGKVTLHKILAALTTKAESDAESNI